VSLQCTMFYPNQFSALRSLCVGEDQFVFSLSRSKNWEANGGKSGSSFCKTSDNRFILKQVSKIELDSFLENALAYFEYLDNAISLQFPTILAKIFGVYSVKFKNNNGEKVIQGLIVMENLFYNKNVTKIYDLKGSRRNRYVNPEQSDLVLLDENLHEVMFTTPIWVNQISKTKLQASIQNDTLFLSSLAVMDYSLVVGIDTVNNKFSVGIIDYIRKYTWDKHVETLVKSSGIMGGKGLDPTIISPDQYKLRFREAMKFYFVLVPDKYTSYRLQVVEPISQLELIN